MRDLAHGLAAGGTSDADLRRRAHRPRAGREARALEARRRALDRLDWLFAGSAVDWSLVPVDDGDPGASADVAEERARAHPRGDRVTVLRLADALPAAEGPLARLAHVDDSRKGGAAIVLGALHGLERGVDAVVMTEAGNSVHLGQAGLLLELGTGPALRHVARCFGSFEGAVEEREKSRAKLARTRPEKVLRGWRGTDEAWDAREDQCIADRLASLDEETTKVRELAHALHLRLHEFSEAKDLPAPPASALGHRPWKKWVVEAAPLLPEHTENG